MGKKRDRLCDECARLRAEHDAYSERACKVIDNLKEDIAELKATVASKQNALNLAVLYREAAEAESERLLAKVLKYEESPK